MDILWWRRTKNSCFKVCLTTGASTPEFLGSSFSRLRELHFSFYFFVLSIGQAQMKPRLQCLKQPNHFPDLMFMFYDVLCWLSGIQDESLFRHTELLLTPKPISGEGGTCWWWRKVSIWETSFVDPPSLFFRAESPLEAEKKRHPLSHQSG